MKTGSHGCSEGKLIISSSEGPPILSQWQQGSEETGMVESSGLRTGSAGFPF
jgi:hypothetical protein